MTLREKNSFEFNVLRVACAIGLLRSIIEVVRDLNAEELLPNFYLDLTFIVVFAGTLIVLKTEQPFKKLLYMFYLPFIAMLLLMFADGRGLAYTIENNVFAGLVIITFTTRGKMTIYLNVLLVITIVMSLILIEIYYQLFDNFIPLNSGKLNFLFSSIGVIAFTLYAKSVFNRNKKNLADTIISMKQRNKSIALKNKELMVQKEILEELTISLDQKVRRDSKKLRTQKRQVEEYLSITLTEMFDAYQETIDSVEQFDRDNDNMASMVVQSGENLKQEMEALRSKIEESI